MKYEISDFVFIMMKEVQPCKYLYKSGVYSLIRRMRDHDGIQCDASDEEIYASFKEAWNACGM